MLLAVWLLAYPGIVYGAGSYTPTYLVEHGWTAHQIFLYGGTGSIIAVPVVVAAFYLTSLVGERFERKYLILIAGTVFAAVFLLLLVFSATKAAVAVLLIVAASSGSLWLMNMYNYTAAAYPTRLRSVAPADRRRRPPRHLPRSPGDRRAVHHHRRPRQLRVDPVVHAAVRAGSFGHHRLARHASRGAVLEQIST